MNIAELAQQTIAIRKSQNVRLGSPTLDPNKIYFNHKSVVLGDNIVKSLTNETREFHTGLDFSIEIQGVVLAIKVPMTDKEKPVIMTEKSGATKILNLRQHLINVYNIPEDQKFTVTLGEFQQVPAIIAQRAGYAKPDTIRHEVMVATITVEYNNTVEEEVTTEEAAIEMTNVEIIGEPTIVEDVVEEPEIEEVKEIREW